MLVAESAATKQGAWLGADCFGRNVAPPLTLTLSPRAGRGDLHVANTLAFGRALVAATPSPRRRGEGRGEGRTIVERIIGRRRPVIARVAGCPSLSTIEASAPAVQTWLVHRTKQEHIGVTLGFHGAFRAESVGRRSLRTRFASRIFADDRALRSRCRRRVIARILVGAVRAAWFRESCSARSILASSLHRNARRRC